MNNINVKKIFDFKYSTLVLFRCLPGKYAKSFLKGEIKFGLPLNWINAELEKGNKGFGDAREGVFLSTSKEDDSEFIKMAKKRYDSFEYENMLYFRKDETKKMFTLCLYGVNDNMFNNEVVDEENVLHNYAIVNKDYFSNFTDIANEIQYLDTDEDERQVVVFILNPHSFFERIKNFFIKFGVDEKDIIISPVEYIDMNKSFVLQVDYPMELFVKDKYFSNQSEVRIVINNTSNKLEEYMIENNGVINIGDISDIAMIHLNYYHDLLLEVKNNELIYCLPFPEETELHDMTLRKLIALYCQFINNSVPQKCYKGYEKEIFINAIEKIIKEKYGIDIWYDDSNMLNISGYDGDLNDILDK